MYAVNQPLSRTYLGNDGAMPISTRAILGDSGVHYDDGGRLVYPGQQPDAMQGPSNRLFWRGGEPPQSAGLNNFRYRPWNRIVVTDPSMGPIVPRRVEGVQASGAPLGRLFYQPPIIDELPYTPAARVAGLPVTSLGEMGASSSAVTSRSMKTTMSPETIVIEEMRVYDTKPCCFWLHLVVGLLMIGVGVANVIVCFEFLHYCYFWTGIAVVIFAVICRIHGGDYIEKKWKSLLLIIVGFVTTALEAACVWLVIVTFIYDAITLAEIQPTDYVTTWKFRLAYYNMTPLVTVNNDYMYNLFICFALNAFQIVLLLASFVVLSTTLIVIDRYYNSHYVISRKVEPFCQPWLFNPWGQCSLGQAMILTGTVVGATSHGYEFVNWFQQYSPVWAGAFPIIAGVAAALSLKSCDKNRKWQHWLAIALEALSLIASLVAIVLMLIELTDNIRTLTYSIGVVMLKTQWNENLLIVSVVTKGFAIIISAANLFYSGVLIFRILACICSNFFKNGDESEDKRFVLDNSDIYEGKSELTLAQQREAEGITAAATYNTSNNPNIPVFSAYRPMGTRSFYA